MQIENNTLYYVYDPMCSWCYGFEQTLADLQRQLPQSLSFKAILGGLAADTSEAMPAETQTMIQQAWHRIQQTVPEMHFNFDFWIKNTPLRSTYPACRALLAAEQQTPELVAALRKNIQQAYYQEAKNPSLDTTLIDCAAQVGLNIEQFSSALNSIAIKIKLAEHIQFSRNLDVNSYPSLRLALADEVYNIAINYSDATPSLKQINTLLDKQQKAIIESPCIRQCCLNNDDICLGCFRTLDEITQWSYYSNTEKQSALAHAAQRKTLYNKNLL
ncbi:MAG: DsbA family protein [Methyloprofundus sp.]|nr:DsbA family protein [Methyloprofundus sp.]